MNDALIERIERLRRVRWLFVFLYVIAALAIALWLTGRVGWMVAYFSERPWRFPPHRWRTLIPNEWTYHVPASFFGLGDWILTQSSGRFVLFIDAALIVSIVAVTAFTMTSFARYAWRVSEYRGLLSQIGIAASLAIPLACVSEAWVGTVLVILGGPAHVPELHKIVHLTLAAFWIAWGVILVLRLRKPFLLRHAWIWMEGIMIASVGLPLVTTLGAEVLLEEVSTPMRYLPPPPWFSICYSYSLFWCWGVMLFLMFTWPRWKGRMNGGLCPACGYDLRASKEKCPECGAAIGR